MVRILNADEFTRWISFDANVSWSLVTTMIVNIKMPQMGESVSEGTLVRWMKKAGERIRQDEPLLEISTEKVETEIASPVDGVLVEIKVKEGETVPVDTTIAVISHDAV
jgi:2-oxoglutarate dehydrogenase E2 component (dihydrolipoamide succinyltransferase)